ncbi:MAG: hypothetical protein QOI98_1088 [Solirubrobacteraceae bacterium]|jgi:hypothetical protein|nr:hypothetical protein [Solirubrobacteraceae bacterium]
MGLLLGLLVALGSVLVAIVWVVLGIRRDWIGAAWLTAAGFALIPSSYMTFVKTCAQIGKTCPPSHTVHLYHQAAITLGLLALAAVVLLARRPGRPGPPSDARRVLFAMLTWIAAMWLADLLIRDHQSLAAFVTALLPNIALGIEIVRQLRERRIDAGIRKLLTNPSSSA